MSTFGNLSDAELINLLKEHNIPFETKTFHKKRDILVKQLNHAFARKRPPSPKKSPSKTYNKASTSQAVEYSEEVPIVTRSTRSRPNLGSEFLLTDVLRPKNSQDDSPVDNKPQHAVYYSSNQPRRRAAPQEVSPPVSTYDFSTPNSSTYGARFISPQMPHSSRIITRSPGSSPIKKEPHLAEKFKDLIGSWMNLQNIVLAVAVVFLLVLIFNSMVSPRRKIDPKRQIANEQITASSVDKLLICRNNKFERPCHPEMVVKRTLPILPFLRSALDTEYLKGYCSGKDFDDNEFVGLTLEKALLLAKGLSPAGDALEPDEDALLDLIHANPHWRIQLVDGEGQFAESVDNAKTLRTINTKIPKMCSMKLLLYQCGHFILKMIVAFFGVFVAVTIGLALFWTIRGKIRYNREYNAKVNEFAKVIVDKVREQYEVSNSSMTASQHTPPPSSSLRSVKDFVVISHLFDELVPLENRAAYSGQWKAAVDLIHRSESRIRTDIRTVDGEHVKVWIWTAGHQVRPIAAACTPTPGPRSRFGKSPANVSSSRMDKSPARTLASPNNSAVGLTPCLKIRGLLVHDDGNDPGTLIEAKRRVKEAAQAMGSCGLRSIFDIQVKNLHDGSLATYVRCADPVASGRLTTSLRKLNPSVVVHYLNVEKFLQQFP